MYRNKRPELTFQSSLLERMAFLRITQHDQKHHDKNAIGLPHIDPLATTPLLLTSVNRISINSMKCLCLYRELSAKFCRTRRPLRYS